MSKASKKQCDRELAEKQIREQARIVDYVIREYPVEVLVQKYIYGKDNDTNEIFIPDYQRDFVWKDHQQIRFIESLLIGLPIPYLFVADINDDNDDDKSGRLEIVDGTQRIRTLERFLNNDLILQDLQKIPALNGCSYDKLLLSRKRRFNRITIRLIELTEKADEETRRDMFDRINSGGTPLEPIETLRGVNKGQFLPFTEKLAQNHKFHEMAPFSQVDIRKRVYELEVLRFFAYLNNYENFGHRVIDFMEDYIKEVERKEGLSDLLQDMEKEWLAMLVFVKKSFRYGFAKAPNTRGTKIARVRLEAIAVGVALALRKKPSLEVTQKDVSKWAYDTKDPFHKMVTADGSNSKPKVIKRIEYVRDKLLEAAL